MPVTGFEAPVALVTGASSGIGSAAARLSAASGYNVELAARRGDHLAELRNELVLGGARAIPGRSVAAGALQGRKKPLVPRPGAPGGPPGKGE